MAGSFYVGGFAPKKPTPNQLLTYCKRISANVKHPSVSYTYAFYSTKKAPANRRSENKNFIGKFEMHPFTQFGCIVSIYGTQASWGSLQKSHRSRPSFPPARPAPGGRPPPAPAGQCPAARRTPPCTAWQARF